jgi:hypothetical protein
MARKAKKQTADSIEKTEQPARLSLKSHYTTYMPKRRSHRVLIWAIVLAAFVIVCAQLLYPPDRGLPLASVPNQSLAMATHETMAKAIVDQFDASKVKLTLGNDKSIEYPLKVTGAEPNTEEMITLLSNYPLWQRFIPGSILWQPARLNEVDMYYSDQTLKQFVDARAKEFSFPASNARLAIDKGKLKATEAIAGSVVTSDNLLSTISRTSIGLGRTTSIEVPSKRSAPARTSKDLAKVQAQATAALAHTVTITADKQTFFPSEQERASWIVLSTGDKGEVSLAVDKDKIKAYLNDVNTKVGTPAGLTNITIVDGREVGRDVGADGRAIDVDAISTQLSAALLVSPPEVKVEAKFVPTQPGIIYNNKYTATQAGLQAYVDDMAASKNMHFSIQQLDGGHWSASSRAEESIPSASTYKLFVALVLFDRIDKGEIHWDDPMLDTTVAGCFDRMTVASTNPCAEKWIAMFGREYINNFIYDRGFSHGTSFTTGSANQTTAADLTKYMTGLNDGTLVKGANRDRLLNNLGRHPYRYGIPTGSSGIVHDKVGFLWDYVHDAAIVQHPRGTYIMTVMTKGQSYAAIASVTREIERIMYP